MGQARALIRAISRTLQPSVKSKTAFAAFSGGGAGGSAPAAKCIPIPPGHHIAQEQATDRGNCGYLKNCCVAADGELPSSVFSAFLNLD